MQFEIEVPYTLPLMKRAAWLYTWKHTKICFLVLLGLGLTIIIVAPFDLFGWQVAAQVISLPLLLFALFYFPTIQNGKNLLKKLETQPTVHFKFTDESVGNSTSLGQAEIFWKTYEKLQRFPDIWLLYPNVHNYFIIPTALLTSEQQIFILDKLKEHQVKIE